MDTTFMADIADLIAAIGVIGSLIFVGLQIRRNARETRLTNFQALAVQATNWARDVAASEELSQLYDSGLGDYSQLSNDERTRFNMLMMSILVIIELFYLQQQRRLQSIVKGEPPHKLLLRLVSCSGFMTWWETDRRVDLGDEMVARIDNLIAERSNRT